MIVEGITVKLFQGGTMPTQAQDINGMLIGGWIDVFSNADLDIKEGSHTLIPLGFAAELPVGYEAVLAARSSLFGKTGLIVANGIGVIDNSYCGDNDEWKLSVFATRDTHITRGQKIAQFRIQKTQPFIMWHQVESLENPDRDGFGSTGE